MRNEDDLPRICKRYNQEYLVSGAPVRLLARLPLAVSMQRKDIQQF
jgi:hypothetical protein